ncbi:MAG TPA: hypothetical protein VM285_05375 [Polyangia bacterium]|nr:hypothetical protein [Polyangia bacterium]
MTDRLTADELVALVRRVFSPTAADERLAFLVDLPDGRAPDTDAWRERRELAREWHELLAPRAAELGLTEIRLALYRNPRANNADLPATCVFHRGGPLPATADDLEGDAVSFDTVFENFRILVAPTQFSATAPLKVAARHHGFRAATMPGFSAAMIPALRIDYGVVGARTARFKGLLDRAGRCDIAFDAAGKRHELVLDLRHRASTASGGVFPAGGVAGNLPSGETYIVPYEGELAGDPTRSAGELPVQFGEDIVVYRVENNRAVEVLTDNPASREERAKLAAEPAYGNLAELGLGVLSDFGLKPTGELLLDEKLGLHIAFGRSEHFGGQVGPDSFSSPERVVHIDRVYTPELQPDVRVARALLVMDDGSELELMRDGAYVVGFD